MSQVSVALVLLLAPVLVVGCLRLLGVSDAAATAATLMGCGVAALGGLLSGAVAERFLHRGRGGMQQLIGVITTTAVSTITIGAIYLVHMRYPMDTIGTTKRALEQLLTFAQFLSAQGAGILLMISRGMPGAYGSDAAK